MDTVNKKRTLPPPVPPVCAFCGDILADVLGKCRCCTRGGLNQQLWEHGGQFKENQTSYFWWVDEDKHRYIGVNVEPFFPIPMVMK